jgi:hypothetical protein
MAMSTHHSSDSPPLVTGTTESRCHRTEADKLAFINFLLDHKAEAGDGGNFKSNIWNDVSVEMLKHTSKGCVKVASKCKAKYILVCAVVLLF